MPKKTSLLAFAAAVVVAAAAPVASSRAAASDASAPPRAAAPAEAAAPPLVYDGDKLRAPPDYREWIYATTGLDMSYSRVNLPGHHMFDNVFVNPAAWQAYKRTGTWADGTVMVLE
ncbi:MAG TPA: cytochrome P460 family protein, partial [Burkholderiaceae bacterium]